MTHRGAGIASIVAVGIALGCDGSAADFSSSDSPAAQRLEGAWVVHLRIERLRFEVVAPNSAGPREVTGTLALVANHWLDGRAVPAALSHYGSYDIDFRRLGFDPRLSGQAPSVEADVRGRDSIDIVVEPNGRERVHLRGAWASDSIVGSWVIEADRTGADASGSFSMTRQRPP